jgi:hypothetical protein
MSGKMDKEFYRKFDEMHDILIKIDGTLYAKNGLVDKADDHEKRLREIEQKMPILGVIITAVGAAIGGMVTWLFGRG